MEKKKRKIGATDIAFLLVSAVFLVGILTFFKPCGPKDDGSFMTCHWAGNAVAGTAAVLVIIAIAHLVVSDAKIKTGLSIAAIPVAVLAAVIPGNLIKLCMMDTMRCHAVMHPAAVVTAVLVMIVAVIDLVVNQKRKE